MLFANVSPTSEWQAYIAAYNFQGASSYSSTLHNPALSLSTARFWRASLKLTALCGRVRRVAGSHWSSPVDHWFNHCKRRSLKPKVLFAFSFEEPLSFEGLRSDEGGN